MKLGLLADVHEDVESLRRALALLRQEGTDQLVVLGDLFYEGKRVAETIDLLVEAGAVGVWGNHDLGLCHEPDAEMLLRYPDRVFDYLRTLGPRLQLQDCLFTHGLPHWNATDPVAYYLEPKPEDPEGLAGSFAASACRVTFTGHFHRWLAATLEGLLPWHGGQPLVLSPEQRYLVVVAAVCDGLCGVYDTNTGVLATRQFSV